MSVDALQLPGIEVLDRLEPFRGACPRCGRRVLAVDVGGLEVVVEVAEVLELFRCPQCEQVESKGHTRSECRRCGLSGWLGEPLPLRGVVLDAAGRARLFAGRRGEGEAVHVFHACPILLH